MVECYFKPSAITCIYYSPKTKIEKSYNMTPWLTARPYVDIAPLYTQACAPGRVSPAHIGGRRPEAHEERYKRKRHVSRQTNHSWNARASSDITSIK